jgi:opacity protein-like surface antigen
MRRYLLASVVAAALLPVLAIASPASAATQTITVYDHQSHYRFTDDSFSFNGTLHADSRNGPVVGSVKVSCSGPRKATTCDATATFSGADGNGQIFVHGTFNGNKNHFFIPITGGNGDFAWVTGGNVERTGITQNDNSGLELLVFHLSG